MKTLILQVATPNIEIYSKYSIIINKSYAEKHNYEYKVFDFVSGERHPSWGKIEHTIQNLKNYERIFMLDADAFINNHSISLDNFLSDKPISICRNDENGGELLNCGSIIFINQPITHELLNIIYKSCTEHLKQNYFWEQSIINSLHNSGVNVPIDKRFAENIEVFESRAFNSWWLDCTHKYNPHQFIQHVMARSNEEKEQIISHFYNDFLAKKVI